MKVYVYPADTDGCGYYRHSRKHDPDQAHQRNHCGIRGLASSGRKATDGKTASRRIRPAPRSNCAE